MDERGLWRLFCKTGLPAAYLAVVGQRREDRGGGAGPGRTAL